MQCIIPFVNGSIKYVNIVDAPFALPRQRLLLWAINLIQYVSDEKKEDPGGKKIQFWESLLTIPI